MDDTEPMRDSIDDPPDLDPSKVGHTVTDRLDEGANQEGPRDLTLGTAAGDPMTAVAGETGYPTPPDEE